MTRFAIMLPLIWLSLSPTVQRADPNSEFTQKLQGTWRVVAAERKGKKAPEEELKSLKVVIDGNKFIFINGEIRSESTFTIDASKKPVWMNSVEKGNMSPILAIVSLEGDTLKMCSFRSKEKRPSEFKSEDSEAVLLVLKRSK